MRDGSVCFQTEVSRWLPSSPCAVHSSTALEVANRVADCPISLYYKLSLLVARALLLTRAVINRCSCLASEKEDTLGQDRSADRLRPESPSCNPSTTLCGKQQPGASPPSPTGSGGGSPEAPTSPCPDPSGTVDRRPSVEPMGNTEGLETA